MKLVQVLLLAVVLHSSSAIGATAQFLEPYSLPWPVAFLDPEHTLGQNVIQHQVNILPYYHGGLDIRAEEGAWVTTPVGGRLEAGHYFYLVDTTGRLVKFF